MTVGEKTALSLLDEAKLVFEQQDRQMAEAEARARKAHEQLDEVLDELEALRERVRDLETALAERNRLSA